MSQNQPAKPTDTKPEPLEAELAKLRASNAELVAENLKLIQEAGAERLVSANVTKTINRVSAELERVKVDLADTKRALESVRDHRDLLQDALEEAAAERSGAPRAAVSHEATAQTSSPAPEDLPDGHPCKPAAASKPVKE